jgi:hypothetical protein
MARSIHTVLRRQRQCSDSKSSGTTWILTSTKRYQPVGRSLPLRTTADRNKIDETNPPMAAPINCATMKPGTWLIAIPAKVVVNPRASVTAGLAKEVDDVNQ